MDCVNQTVLAYETTRRQTSSNKNIRLKIIIDPGEHSPLSPKRVISVAPELFSGLGAGGGLN